MEFTNKERLFHLETRVLGTENSGAWVLCIAGKSCTMNMWRGLPERLVAYGYRVILFDNRDMGLTEKFADITPEPSLELAKHREGKSYVAPYSLEDMADDCIRVLDQYEVPQAHLIGASLGGLIAQIVGCRHTDRVKSLSLIMTTIDINGWAAKGFLANPDFFIKIITSPSPTPNMSLEEFLSNRINVWSELLTDSAHPDLSKDEESLLIAEMTFDYERGGVDWGDLGGMRQMLATNIWTDNCLKSHEISLSQLHLKTLILHGKYDPLVPFEGAAQLASVIPNSSLQTYEGGHNLPLDQQERLAKLISDHIASC